MMNWARSSFRKKNKDEEEVVKSKPKEGKDKKKVGGISSMLSPACTKGNTLDSEPYKRSTASVVGETPGQDETNGIKKKRPSLLKRISSKRHSKQSISSLSIAEEGRNNDAKENSSETGSKVQSGEESNNVSISSQKQTNSANVRTDSADVGIEVHDKLASSGNANTGEWLAASNEETSSTKASSSLSAPRTEVETMASADKVSLTDTHAASIGQTTAKDQPGKLPDCSGIHQSSSKNLNSVNRDSGSDVVVIRAPPRSGKNRNSSSSNVSTEEQQSGTGNNNNNSSRQTGKVSNEVNNSEGAQEPLSSSRLRASGTAAVDQSQTFSSVCGGTASGEAGDLATAAAASKPSPPPATSRFNAPQVEQEVVIERVSLSQVSEKNREGTVVRDDVVKVCDSSSGGTPEVGVTNSGKVGTNSQLEAVTGNSNPDVVSGGGDDTSVSGPSKKELECLGALLDSIIVDGDPSGGRQNTPELIRSSAHGGNITYEVGGDSGKEVTVNISEDFNKSAADRVEVVEAPLVKKYFAPLTVKQENKSQNNSAEVKVGNPVTVQNSSVPIEKVISNEIKPLVITKVEKKKFNSDSLLDDIVVDGQEINSSGVVEKKSAYGGKVTYEIGGKSAKEVTVNISEDFNKGNSVEVVEEPITKRYFAPLGNEEEKSVTEDTLLSSKKTTVCSPIKSGIVSSNKEPVKTSSTAPQLTKNNELQITEDPDDLGDLLAELETVIEDLEHLKATPAVDYSKSVPVQEKSCVKKHFTPLTPADETTLPSADKTTLAPADELRISEDTSSDDGRGSVEDVTKLQRLSTHEVTSKDAGYTSPETFYTPMNVFKVLGSLKQTSLSTDTAETLVTDQTTNIQSPATVTTTTNSESTVGAESGELTCPSSCGTTAAGDEEEVETMDVVQGRAGLRHPQHGKDRFVHFSGPGVAVLRSQRSHPPITEEPSSGSPIRHGPSITSTSPITSPSPITKIESTLFSSSSTNTATGAAGNDKSSMVAPSATGNGDKDGSVLRATLAEEEEFDDIDDTLTTGGGEVKNLPEGGLKTMDSQKEQGKSAPTKVDDFVVAVDDKSLLDRNKKKEVSPLKFSLRREVSEPSPTEKEPKSPVTRYGFNVFKQDSKHTRHGSDKRKSKSPERKDNTSSSHQRKTASPVKTDENCNVNKAAVIVPKLELNNVEGKEVSNNERVSPVNGDRPSPVPPVLITVTAATPVKVQKQVPSLEDQSKQSDRPPAETAWGNQAPVDTVERNGVISQEVDHQSQTDKHSETNGKKDESNPFGDEDDEVISIELQRESSVKLQNRINVTLSKAQKDEQLQTHEETAQPTKPEKPVQSEHVVNIRKEIEKLNKRMEENSTSRKSLPSSERSSVTKFDVVKPLAKSLPESNREKVDQEIAPSSPTV